MGFKCPICHQDFGTDKEKWNNHVHSSHHGAGGVFVDSLINVTQAEPKEDGMELDKNINVNERIASLEEELKNSSEICVHGIKSKIKGLREIVDRHIRVIDSEYANLAELLNVNDNSKCQSFKCLSSSAETCYRSNGSREELLCKTDCEDYANCESCDYDEECTLKEK